MSLKRILQFCFFIFAGAFPAFGQRALDDLQPKHAAALRAFLAQNRSLEFLSEDRFDAGYLKEAREVFSLEGAPYYKTGDFNQDRIQDFAVILLRRGKPKKGSASDAGTPLDLTYPLSVAIFNGARGGTFRLAYLKNLEAPLVSFLRLSFGTGKYLTFSTVELAADMLLKPKGKTYFDAYPDEP